MAMLNLKSRLRLGAAFLKDRHGGAAIVMGVMTPVIIGGLAFGAEVGGWELTKRQVQNAADVSAFAAATQVRSGADNDAIEAAAEAVAEESGFKGGDDNLDIEYPPSSAPNAADGTDPNGNGSYVYVTLTQTAPKTFTKWFSDSDTVTFVSSALAHVENGRPACVLALNPSASGSIYVAGSANVDLTGCDVAANSISTSAVETNGGAADLSTNCVSTVGGVNDGGGVIDLTECAEPIENAAVTADPYKNKTMPTCSGTPQNGATFTSGANPKSHATGGCWGTNSGTTNISVTKTINLASNQTYIFKNVNMTVNGNGVINGTNVTLVFEGDSSLTVNGNGDLNITAPTSSTSPSKGIAIWGDKNYDNDFDLSGTSGVAVVGAIYSPNNNSKITYIGDSSGFVSGQCTQVIGGQVAFTGNADFDTDCSGSGTTAIMAGQTIKIVG